MRPDVMAVCHGHPPTATGFAVAGRALNHALLPEVVVGLGQIPLVQYATPGTQELSDAIEPFVPHYDALLLANHGAVTCGPDLLTAFFRMETIEHSAKITLASGNGRRAGVALQPRSCQAHGCASALLCVATAGWRRRNCLSRVNSGENSGDDVTLTRSELDALIDEAVRKDRTRR